MREKYVRGELCDKPIKINRSDYIDPYKALAAAVLGQARIDFHSRGSIAERDKHITEQEILDANRFILSPLRRKDLEFWTEAACVETELYISAVVGEHRNLDYWR